MPADGRITVAGDDLEEARHRRASERNFRVVDAAVEIAARHDRPVPQIALAWLLGTPGITATIIGPRTLAQLEDLLGATNLTLDDAERASLETPAPPPEISPQRILREQLQLPDVLPIRRAGGGRR
jgi:aryl-alcohol dehydrogenase-like predicted oxidoreductase